MATLERTYTIPLRKEWLKVPKYKRAKKTVAAVREFLEQHMKSADVRLGKYLNLAVWKHGIKNPPSRLRITAAKDDKNTVRAELFGAPKEETTKEKKTKKTAEEKKETLQPTPAEQPKQETAQEAPKKPRKTKTAEKKEEKN